MPTIRYIPKCHLKNFNEFQTQSEVELIFDVESARPRTNYRENIEYALDGEPCVTTLSQSIEIEMQVKYIPLCDIDNWMEFISSAKCSGDFYCDVCDVGLAGFRPGNRAILRGNPNWQESGSHGMSLTFTVRFIKWGCN